RRARSRRRACPARSPRSCRRSRPRRPRSPAGSSPRARHGFYACRAREPPAPHGCRRGMRRLLIVTATATALLLPAVASAWEGVSVEVTFPERVTAGQVSVLDFHVSVGGKPLDLSTVGPRIPGLQPRSVEHTSELQSLDYF